MAEYTKFVTLDSILRTYLRNVGANYMHGWGKCYSFGRQALLELDLSKVQLRGTSYMSLELSGGRAEIPEWMSSVTGVGVKVGGHIQWMRYDANMIDLPGGCGGFDPEVPANPDIPSVRSSGAPALLYTGAVTSAFGPLLYYPGMNRNKSINGYYKIFPFDRYVLVDHKSSEAYDSIVVEYIAPALQPGVVTWVPELITQYVATYINYKDLEFTSYDRTKMRPVVEKARQLWLAEKSKLATRSMAPPPAELWAAACLLT